MSIRKKLVVIAVCVALFVVVQAGFVAFNYFDVRNNARQFEFALDDLAAVVRFRASFLRQMEEAVTHTVTGGDRSRAAYDLIRTQTGEYLRIWVDTERRGHRGDPAATDVAIAEKTSAGWGVINDLLEEEFALRACGDPSGQQNSTFLDKIEPQIQRILHDLGDVRSHEREEAGEAFDGLLAVIGTLPTVKDEGRERITNARLALEYFLAIDGFQTTVLEESRLAFLLALGAGAPDRGLRNRVRTRIAEGLRRWRAVILEQKAGGVAGEHKDLALLDRIAAAAEELTGHLDVFISKSSVQTGYGAAQYLESTVEPLLDDRILPLIDQTFRDGEEEIRLFEKSLVSLIRRATAWTLGVILVFGLLVSGTVVGIVGRLVVGFTRLAEGAEEFGRGRLATRIQADSKDEIGILAATMNRMADDLAGATVSREYLNDILHSTNDGIFVVDGTGRIETANPAACALVGYDEGDLIGRAFSDLTADGTKTCDALLAEGETHGREGTLIKATGEAVPVVFSAALLGDGVDPARGFVCAAQNISAIKRVQNQLLQAQKMEAIGTLAGGLAHDFNNTLSVVLGNSHLALYKLAPDHPATVHVSAVAKAAEVAGGLTRQLLAMSRRQPLDIRPVELTPLIRDLVAMLKRLMGPRIVLTFDTPEVPVIARADHAQVEQILMNLVLNARDALPDGGRIRIAIGHKVIEEDPRSPEIVPGRYVILQVSDDGIGMMPEVRNRIFEPFFTTKPEGRGTGLGLASVYGIVAQLEGCITCESAEGAGTTFEVLLPSAGVPSRESDRRSFEARESETVLFVDDDDLLRGVAADTLEAFGYRVVTAASGKEAEEIVNRTTEPIDLLVTDVVMPGISGFDLAERLRDRVGAVMLVSGHNEDGTLKSQAHELGVTFFGKPITPSRFLAVVRRVLDERPRPGALSDGERI